MAKIDNSFTLKMKKWLEAKEHTDYDDIMSGALMVLQLNKNRAMYNSIAMKPEKYVSKIVYELSKFLPIRLAEMTMQDVEDLDKEITPSIKEAIEQEPEGNADKMADEMDLPLRKGKREDHSKLPAEIQAIWLTNADRWKKIKEAYNTCITLERPCDRFEYLTIMKDLWYAYKDQMNLYDTYQVTEDNPKVDTSNDNTDPVEIVKQINNARSYISKNIQKLLDAKKSAEETPDEDKLLALKGVSDAVSERVKTLLVNKQVIGDELNAQLMEGGISVSNLAKDNEPKTENVDSAPAVE